MKKITFLILFFLIAYGGMAQSKIEKSKGGTSRQEVKAATLNKNKVSLYPNPVRDKLKIRHSKTIKIKSATLYNMLGKTTSVTLSPDQTMDTSNLSSGVYVLRLKTNVGTLSKKVVKN